MQFDWLKRREFITFSVARLPLGRLLRTRRQPKNIPRLCFLTFDPVTSRSSTI